MKTVIDFRKMKESGEKITMMTAYDYPSGKLVESAETDIILVGDSLGMTILGYESTMPVTIDDMVHHAKATRRGARETFIIADMPFASYHLSDSEVVKNATRLLQVGQANAVKVEGAVIDQLSLLTKVGIPVVAHLGLTPQTIGVDGVYQVKGKTSKAAKDLIEEAREVELAGAVMLVLECVPEQLAERITKELSIPVIGIGAGIGTDGQVLVFHDMILYGVERTAKFVKVYADVNTMVKGALAAYNKEVKAGLFPSAAHAYQIDLGLDLDIEEKDESS